VVVPVRDRADAVGRVVTGVLTQTFADTEVIVVDDGSTDEPGTTVSGSCTRNHRARRTPSPRDWTPPGAAGRPSWTWTPN
jgi:glycosyltransferase involved in cell wall biosynthesis